MWLFIDYKTGMSGGRREFLGCRIFFNYNQMKDFSSNRGLKYKKIHPEYCSMYWKLIVSKRGIKWY